MYRFLDKFDMGLESYRGNTVHVVSYAIDVGGALSLSEMVSWLNFSRENISPDMVEKYFPIASSPKKPQRVSLFCFDPEVGSREDRRMLADMLKGGNKEIFDMMKHFSKRPATVDVAIALCLAVPDLRDRFIVTALGSIALIDGVKKAPCLRNLSVAPSLATASLSTVSAEGLWTTEFAFPALDVA